MSEYIERQKAYEVLSDYYHHSTMLQHLALKDALLKVPAADVRPVVRGHDTGEDRYFCCSECGYGVDDVFESGSKGVLVFEHNKTWNFCPNCGADMRQKEG